MQSVSLDSEEWQKVIAIVASAPWNVANPLLMKIGEQLRQQQNISSPRLRDGKDNEEVRQ